MNYCDLHCDTPLELYRMGSGFESAPLNINGSSVRKFERYLQICAYCVPPRMENELGYRLFFDVVQHFKEAVSDFGVICDSRRRVAETEAGVPGFILSVEDGRILDGDISRLQVLFDCGVRIITPLWGGESCVGGSHESAAGLTDFGRELVSLCGELGIITDISHASEKSAREILAAAADRGMPVIASHSCAAALNPHSRNLSDAMAHAVAESGGIVGVNSYPPHLTGGDSSLSDVARHIAHFAALIGEDKVALGMDFDGMGACMTDELEGISDIPSLRREMKSHGFFDKACERIFYRNAFDFLKAHLADQA